MAGMAIAILTSGLKKVRMQNIVEPRLESCSTFLPSLGQAIGHVFAKLSMKPSLTQILSTHSTIQGLLRYQLRISSNVSGMELESTGLLLFYAFYKRAKRECHFRLNFSVLICILVGGYIRSSARTNGLVLFPSKIWIRWYRNDFQ